MIDSTSFIEHEKSILVNGAKLSGTLCLHESVAPQKVILMIPGSGEVDRNENAMKLQLNILNSLAHSFAQQGIASMRFDKRGCASSEGRYHETGFHEFVDDAGEWLRNPDVKGQILLTPFLENMELLIERQLQRTLDEVSVLTGFKGLVVRVFLRLSGNQLKRQRKVMKRIKNSKKSSIKIKKTLINAKWLRELCEIEPADVFSKVKVPTLAIGGEKDLQCLPEDTQKLAGLVQAPVDSHVLSDLTHILRTDEEEPSTFRYKKLSEEPIDSRVPELILSWLKSSRL